MGSLVLRSLLVVVAVLAFGCSAIEDEPDMTQREVVFDLSEIMGGKGPSQPDPDMTQREDFDQLPEAGPDITQREVTFGFPKFLRERGSRKEEPDMTQKEVTDDLVGHFEEMDPPVFVPRSSKPDLPFPPARPSMHNLPAICLDGEGRPRYPLGSLPVTGFSHLRRQGDAINHVESLYSFCCQRNGTQGQELSLCCAQQAWEHALNDFCKEEFSIKTRHYHCCKKQGGARWSCFDTAAPSPSYQATSKPGSVSPKSPPDPGFTWNPNTCQRGSKAKITNELKPDISFPPGRPTSYNIGLACSLRKLRPRYHLKCLPSNAYGWLERQSKAINRMEKAIKQCCKGRNEVLTCVDRQWLVVMDRYCREEHSVKNKPFSCCDLPEGQERYTCFSSRAPNPEYDRELGPREISPPTFKAGLVCDTHKLLKKKFPVPLPIKRLVSQCCHLPAAQRTPCVQGKLDDLMESMCAGEEPMPPAVSSDCCLQTSSDSNCLFKLLLEAVIKANRSSGVKKKCPLV